MHASQGTLCLDKGIEYHKELSNVKAEQQMNLQNSQHCWWQLQALLLPPK